MVSMDGMTRKMTLIDETDTGCNLLNILDSTELALLLAKTTAAAAVSPGAK
jgi:hypothetical protein